MPNDFERLLRDVPGAFPRPDDVATASARRSALSRATRRRLPRLSLVAAAAVAASATVGFTAGHWLIPAQGDAATAVALAATPDDVTYGDTFTLYGSLTSGRAHQTITIEARDCGVGTYHVVGQAETVSGGAFASELTTYPKRTTEYRARWHGGASPPTPVQIRPRIDVRYANGLLHVRVSAGASARGHRAILQMYDTHGSPQTLRAFVVRDAVRGTGGEATVRIRLPRDRVIRVVLPRIGPCFADGVSPPAST